MLEKELFLFMRTITRSSKKRISEFWQKTLLNTKDQHQLHVKSVFMVVTSREQNGILMQTKSTRKETNTLIGNRWERLRLTLYIIKLKLTLTMQSKIKLIMTMV